MLDIYAQNLLKWFHYFCNKNLNTYYSLKIMHLLLTNLFCVILLINPTVIIFNICCKYVANHFDIVQYEMINNKKEPYTRCNKTFSLFCGFI